jgi:hypothetical protein
MDLLKSVFGGVSASGYKKAKWVITMDGSSSNIYLQINQETELTVNLTTDEGADTEAMLAAVNGAVGSVVTATYVDDGDYTLGLILTGSDLFTATTRGTGGSSAAITVMSGYTHKLVGRDTVPNVPLSFTFYEDLSCMNLVGCYPTSFDIQIDKGNPVQLTMAFAGMHGFDQKGTAAYEGSGGDTGGGPLTFPVTLSGASITAYLVGGASTAAIPLTDGTYATMDDLIAMINERIAATPAACDAYRRPLFAAKGDMTRLYFGNPSPGIIFYSDAKGSGVAWDTINVSGIFPGTTTSWGVAAATDTNVKPSESTIQPFIATKVRLFLGGPSGAEIPGVEKLKISVNNGMGLLETIGFYFAHIPVIHKRREVKIQFDMAFTDPTILAKFLANTTIALYVLLETGVAIGSTTDTYKAAIYLNNCKILKTPLPAVSGQEYIKQTVEAQAFADPTYQDIEIDVVNSLPTA